MDSHDRESALDDDLDVRLDRVNAHLTIKGRLSIDNKLMLSCQNLDVRSFLICRELLRGAIPDDELSVIALGLTTDPGRFGNPNEDLANAIAGALDNVADAINNLSETQSKPLE